jgi:hypothetical protein
MSLFQKLIISVFFLGLFCSCHGRGGNKSINSKTISFSIDTVVVDAKNEFLFLNGGLAGAFISQNKNLLYVLNRIEIALEIIDLNTLELKEKIQFETEGPNGIGPWLSAFSIYEDEKLFFIQIIGMVSLTLLVKRFRLLNLKFELDTNGVRMTH